jgi:hypothetical protein
MSHGFDPCAFRDEKKISLKDESKVRPLWALPPQILIAVYKAAKEQHLVGEIH